MSDKKLPDYFEFYAGLHADGTRLLYKMVRTDNGLFACKLGMEASIGPAHWKDHQIIGYLENGTWMFAPGYGYKSAEPTALPEEFCFHVDQPEHVYNAKVDGPFVSVTWNHYGGSELNRTVYTTGQVREKVTAGKWTIVPAAKVTPLKEAAKRIVELVKEDIASKPTYPDLKEGDKVRVVRRSNRDDPDGMGPGQQWVNSWVSTMDKALGRIGTVRWENSNSGIALEVEGIEHVYRYPLKALELVETTERSFDRRLELKLDGRLYRAYDDECQEMADVKRALDEAVEEVKEYEGFLQDRKDTLELARKALERFKVT